MSEGKANREKPRDMVLKETPPAYGVQRRELAPDFTQRFTTLFHRAKKRALSDKPAAGKPSTE
jgi:hypothetical protein